MIDRVDRLEARFPAGSEGLVALRIFENLELLDAGSGDLGICGGAAGGDLIFSEACLGRGLALEILLPQPEETFLGDSVDPSGTGWRERYANVTKASTVRTVVMAEDYLAGEGLGLYSRHTRWLVERALTWGADRLRVIVLWDGQPGDGSGGTADLLLLARQHTDRVRVVAPQ